MKKRYKREGEARTEEDEGKIGRKYIKNAHDSHMMH